MAWSWCNIILLHVDVTHLKGANFKKREQIMFLGRTRLLSFFSFIKVLEANGVDLMQCYSPRWHPLRANFFKRGPYVICEQGNSSSRAEENLRLRCAHPRTNWRCLASFVLCAVLYLVPPIPLKTTATQTRSIGSLFCVMNRSRARVTRAQKYEMGWSVG